MPSETHEEFKTRLTLEGKLAEPEKHVTCLSCASKHSSYLKDWATCQNPECRRSIIH
jgi:hypothetical protein